MIHDNITNCSWMYHLTSFGNKEKKYSQWGGRKDGKRSWFLYCPGLDLLSKVRILCLKREKWQLLIIKLRFRKNIFVVVFDSHVSERTKQSVCIINRNTLLKLSNSDWTDLGTAGLWESWERQQNPKHQKLTDSQTLLNFSSENQSWWLVCLTQISMMVEERSMLTVQKEASLGRSEWRPLIGPDPSRYCALIGWDHGVATPALLCHKDTAQGTLSPLLGAFLVFRCVLLVQGCL